MTTDEAMRALRAFPWRVTGRTLLQRFREDRLGLTASSNPVDRDRCLDAGMNEVLHKPLDETQLVAQLSRLSWLVSSEAHR